MIPLAIEDFFFAFLAAWMLPLAVLWLCEQWRPGGDAWTPSVGCVCFCGDCHFAFLLRPRENVSRCPRCGAICYANKRRK